MKMWKIIFIKLLFMGFTGQSQGQESYFCGSPTPCNCLPLIKTVDCVNRALEFIPVFETVHIQDMEVLLLNKNRLSNIKPNVDPTHWISLKVIDLRDNPSLNCSTLDHLTKYYHILSNCIVMETTTYSLTTAVKLQPVNATKESIKHSNHLIGIIVGTPLAIIVLGILIAFAIYKWKSRPREVSRPDQYIEMEHYPSPYNYELSI